MSKKPMTAAEAKRTMKAERERLNALELPAPALDERYELILTSYVPRSVDLARWMPTWATSSGTCCVAATSAARRPSASCSPRSRCTWAGPSTTGPAWRSRT